MYTILQSVLPIALMAGTDGSHCTLDKVVRVYCALVNLSISCTTRLIAPVFNIINSIANDM